MSERPEPAAQPPAVTIVTPLFESARFVPGLLANVAAQEFGDFEHLVVDDRSTDGGAELVRAHAARDPRCRLIRMDERGGPARARDRALAEARGRFVAFLDADDRWLPSKLRLQVEFMRRGGIGFSYHDYRFMSADGTRVGALVRGPDRLDFAGLHRHRGVGCSTVMVDRTMAPGLSFSRVRAARASDFERNGPMIMTMLRPSTVGVDSIAPNSATSAAKRCSKRTPCSGRDCSRPRNRIMALTLSP